MHGLYMFFDFVSSAYHVSSNRLFNLSKHWHLASGDQKGYEMITPSSNNLILFSQVIWSHLL
ncbi:MAG: hypothetical protein PSX81_13200 [bacterium]|nr:hypothetical protein [bacterium]